MRAKVTASDRGAAIILEPPLLDMLDIRPDTEVDIEPRHGTLIVRTVPSEQRNPVYEAFKRVLDHPEDITSLHTVHGAET